jgi:hypothetical protein
MPSAHAAALATLAAIYHENPYLQSLLNYQVTHQLCPPSQTLHLMLRAETLCSKQSYCMLSSRSQIWFCWLVCVAGIPTQEQALEQAPACDASAAGAAAAAAVTT